MLKLKKVELDEIELYYNILKEENPEKINLLTYQEIADVISENFEVYCSGKDIFILHEPTFDDLVDDITIHYNLITR